MLAWADDLKLHGADLYLDSRRPRAACFISHAHSDHIALHQHAIAMPATALLTAHRLGEQRTTQLEYDQPWDLDRQTTLRLLPAGHIVGSAMLHVTRPEGTLLYTGDFKLRTSLTVERARPAPADTLIMECTFGQPFFRFPPWEQVAARLVELCAEALREGRQPIVMGYTLGKAQEIIRILSDARLPITVHGAIANICRLHESLGVELGAYRHYSAADFHGPRALDPLCRGVLVAPPNVARSGFVTRFDRPCRIVVTGWALLKNAVYRYGVDHALPLSDHADFDELMQLIEQVHPRKIFTHHGPREFADILRSRGLDATPARPMEMEQMRLFE
jgi:Cft2 family RNA processing exonuclease